MSASATGCAACVMAPSRSPRVRALKPRIWATRYSRDSPRSRGAYSRPAKSRPWQSSQWDGAAGRGPVSARAGTGRGASTASETATAVAQRAKRGANGERVSVNARARGTRGGRTAPPGLRGSAPVRDAIDRARVVVGDQQRPVLHLPGVDRPAPDLVALQPALGERLVPRHVALPQRDHHHAEADLLGAVPRAALGKEHSVPVLRREHRARIELDAVAGHLRSRLDQRRRELAARAARVELRVRD